MKRVLIFSTAYLPFWGGAEVAIKELTDRMTSYEFDLITARMDRKLPKCEIIGRVNVYRVGLGGKLDKFLLPLLGLRLVFRLERRQKYGLIFSLMASQASIAAAFFKIFYPEKKLILNLQEGDEESYLKRYVWGSDLLYRLFIRPWHVLVFKKADLITVISEYLKKRALANGVKCQVEVVPNGVNVNKFSIFNFQFSIKDLKNNLGVKEDDKIIITASRLVKKNAVEYIIKSLRYLPHNIKLLILGDGPLKKELEILAEKSAVASRVIFFGKYDNDILPQYLAISDVFVRPSLSEGQGISFLEAMAAGVPIVGTAVGGIVDFLRDGETGLFCQVSNPESIAEKVKLILSHDNLRSRLINNGRKLMREKYDWSGIARRMEKIFDNIITRIS